jgi:ubiquinone biosynthesis protein COQ9
MPPAAEAGALSEPTHAERASASSSAEVEDAIYELVLKLAPANGWNGTCLAQAAQEAGFPAVSAGVFERGAVDCVLRLLRSQRHALESRFASDTALRFATTYYISCFARALTLTIVL